MGEMNVFNRNVVHIANHLAVFDPRSSMLFPDVFKGSPIPKEIVIQKMKGCVLSFLSILECTILDMKLEVYHFLLQDLQIRDIVLPCDSEHRLSNE